MSDNLWTIPTEHFTIEGRSRAGHETFFRIRELGVALDIGRCPDAVISMSHVLVSHAHLDHAAGIPFYGAQRHLQRLDGGTVYVPSEALDDFRALLEVQARLTGAPLEMNLRGVAAGEEVRMTRRLLVRGHRATHRVAARAYELIEVRHHLKDELHGRTGEELARMRKDGLVLDEEFRRSIIFYTGDTDRGLLETNEALFKAEVLMIECSFIIEGHQERAARYRHIHIDDIAEFAERFENETIVLTHFSRRYSPDEIRNGIRRRLPHVLRDRIRLALPAPYQRL
ncbi:MAG TPA: MBL fold metallo-hydrolase [Thermoanaerobaculia bacterium]|jgi:ribonuclease Z